MDKVIEQINTISQKYSEISKVVLFGSRARGTNNPQSDYDIAVFTFNDKFSEKMSFYNDIDEIDTLYKIDVIMADEAIDKNLKQNIKKEGVAIMERENKILNYVNAVNRLDEALHECGDTPTSLNRDGAIQRFEFSAELAWKACREYLMDMGYGEINGPKPVMKEALQHGLIDNSDAWTDILNDRNLTSHIYKEEIAFEIFERIKKDHITAFKKLSERFIKILS